MRILIITPYLPWPLKTGGNAAMFSTIQCLSNNHHFTLVCPVSDRQQNDVEMLQSKLPGLNLRAVRCIDVPGRRKPFLWLMERVKQLMKYADMRQQELPWDPFIPVPQLFAEVVQEEVALGPDLCQVEFVQMMSMVSLLPGSIPKVFVHHQIHFVYNKLTWAAANESVYLHYLLGRQRAIELGHLSEYDAILTFSEDDKMILEAEADLPPVYVSAFPVPADMTIVSEVPSAFSGKFFFLGSEEHPPNREGLGWLLDELWPSIAAKVEDSELVIFGSWNADWRKRAAASKGHISFPGFVPDLGRALVGGILLVPLRVGSGIRTKILAALSQAMPCVATTVAAEGLPTGSGGGVIRADTNMEFVDAAVELATRPECWKTRADAGPDYVRKFHSPEVVRLRRNEIYQHVMKTYRGGIVPHE